jgi:catechol 2,3-dioxygenase-like lactoylglutathione lyase family enzyme
MQQQLAHVALLVRDYEEALAFYTGKLGFRLVADTSLGAGKRWVLVAPPGTAGGSALLLAKAEGAAQLSQVGQQAGVVAPEIISGQKQKYPAARLLAQGVEFQETPREESYATVAVFADLYGNLWDLLQPKAD